MPRFFGEVAALKPKLNEPDPLARLAPQGRPAPRKLLLYVHVPFCRSKCRYCAFHSQVYNQVTASWYVKAVEAEIRLWGQRLSRPPAETLYFGGGTPSLLSIREIERIVTAARQSFDLDRDAEITLEANPDSTGDSAWFSALAALGVNRLSLGVQSLNDEHLAMLGRPHSSAQAQLALALARRAGFANVGLDLIWGLPGQRLVDWTTQLRTVVKEMAPQHLSCYGLTLEPGTELARRVESGELSLPPEEEQARMYVLGAEYLESEALLHYEVSNFARMGFASRHNSGYWEGRDYLGFGPSAASTLGSRRFTNPRPMEEYGAAVAAGAMGKNFETLDRDTLLRERIMLGLRTTRGFPIGLYEQLTDRPLTKDKAGLLKALRANGLAKLNQGRLRLTKNGMLVSNAIIGRILE